MASMRALASVTAQTTSEYLFGETLVLENQHCDSGETATQAVSHQQWYQLRAERDGYTGYMQQSDLELIKQLNAISTHWVSKRSTLIFSEPSIKSPVLHRLPFLAKVTVKAIDDQQFYMLTDTGYIWRDHLLPTDQHSSISPVQLARSCFIDTPYLWGGCTPFGVDCSGLVQALANAHAIALPRDCKDQEPYLQQSIELPNRQPEDLVYWPGHVGILSDKNTLLHATAHSLSCIEEPLDDVVQRAGEISSIKRLF